MAETMTPEQKQHLDRLSHLVAEAMRVCKLDVLKFERLRDGRIEVSGGTLVDVPFIEVQKKQGE